MGCVAGALPTRGSYLTALCFFDFTGFADFADFADFANFAEFAEFADFASFGLRERQFQLKITSPGP
jgi:hypothetical protein